MVDSRYKEERCKSHTTSTSLSKPWSATVPTNAMIAYLPHWLMGNISEPSATLTGWQADIALVYRAMRVLRGTGNLMVCARVCAPATPSGLCGARYELR